MESRLKASTDPHGRWDMAVQDRPPPSLPPHVLPGYRNMRRPAPRTCAVGIHPTVAKFESQRPGSRRDGWDASRGTVRGTGFIPGPNGYLGVTIWPWVSPMPTWPVENPQNQAFPTRERGPLAGRRRKPVWTARVMSDPDRPHQPRAEKTPTTQQHNTTSQERSQIGRHLTTTGVGKASCHRI